ncbi:MAG: hypothetical protein RMM53_00310 [Bacteroidia bacterium]|nr:hypothetical protein [Bacteroidia bacterium]MDW8332636.1 hypothetical protein [Bacteroidia bacterium]
MRTIDRIWRTGATAAIAIVCAACRPESEPEPVRYGVFEINVRPSFNGVPLQTGLYYTLDTLRVRIDTLQLLLTGPALEGGASFFDRAFLYSFVPQTRKTTHGPGVYYVFEVEARNYAGARVRCGLPDGMNGDAQPPDFPDNHPLGIFGGLFDFEQRRYAHAKIVGKTVVGGDTTTFRHFLTESAFEFAVPSGFAVRPGRETQWILETELPLLFKAFSPRQNPRIADDQKQAFVAALRNATYSYLREY